MVTRALAAFAVLATLSGPACLPVLAQDPTIDYRTGDPEMSAAVAAARNDLGRFVDIFRSGGGERFTVKVAIPVKGTNDREHIWMTLDAIEGDVFVGRIANEPQRLAPLRQGSSYRAAYAMISDWGYWRDGLRYGNYTTRLILKRLPANATAEIRRTLSPRP